ncbi:MAG: tol-pal system protein YbgF [Vibrio sp.]
MNSNLKRIITLTLLVSAASSVLAATSETAEQRLQRLLDNSNRIQANLQQQVDSQKADISDLRGTLERNTYEMKQMTERQRQLYIELDNLRNEVAELKKSGGAAAATTGAAASSAPKASTASTTASVSPKVAEAPADEAEAYKAAVDLVLKDKNYDGAITALKDFQTKYPNSAYSANSHYWLGQLYFAKKQDVDSAKSFAAVASYKDTPKRPDALVKLGDIAKRNNNPTAAKKYYEQVVSEYPNSSAAQLAKSNL